VSFVLEFGKTTTIAAIRIERFPCGCTIVLSLVPGCLVSCPWPNSCKFPEVPMNAHDELLPSLLKNPSGHGIGLPMKAMLMISVIRIERCSLATQSPCMGSERACIRATQLRTATTPGTATAVQVQSPQTVQAARRS
jgi:hypothetical protein